MIIGVGLTYLVSEAICASTPTLKWPCAAFWLGGHLLNIRPLWITYQKFRNFNGLLEDKEDNATSSFRPCVTSMQKAQ